MEDRAISSIFLSESFGFHMKKIYNLKGFGDLSISIYRLHSIGLCLNVTTSQKGKHETGENI